MTLVILHSANETLQHEGRYCQELGVIVESLLYNQWNRWIVELEALTASMGRGKRT